MENHNLKTITRCINKFTIIYVLIFIASCKTIPEDWEKEIKSVDNMFRTFHKEITVSAETYISDSIRLLDPFAIKIIDDYMLIKGSGRSADGIVSAYDMTNKRFIGKMINNGKGPNEFLGVRMNAFGKDTLLVLDPYKKSAQLFGINEIKKCSAIPARSVKFQSPNKGEQISQCYLFNDHLICSGEFQKERFQVYNTKGGFLNGFGEYPQVNFSENKIDNIQLGYVFGSDVSFVWNSQNSKIACINKSTLSIYDYNKNKDEFMIDFFVQWFSPKIGEATYKDGKPYVTRSAKECWAGAGNLAANNKYIFFPFSNYRISDLLKGGIENEYQFIFVSKWDGKPVARLKLDKPIHFPLEIGKDGKHLYSIHTDIKSGFDQIVRYEVSFLE